MPDVFRTSLSGLLAFQRAIAVTGNNIANANTEGYSRQRVELQSRPPQGYGSGFIGNGVDLTTVTRIYDDFSVEQLRTASSQLGQLTSYANYAGRVDNLVGNATTGIASGVQSFFNAWQSVSNDPANVTARQLLLGEANSLADRLQQTSSRLSDIEADINSELRSTVGDINSLATSIASLNDKIVKAQASVGQPPNDLLDQRDNLVTQLSELANVTTTADSDGAVNVFIGSGQPIVLRDRAIGLQAVPNSYDPSRLDVAYLGNAGAQVITTSLTGGKIGGLLDVRTSVLDGARNTLGQITTAIVASVNEQHHEGMDLSGQLGQDLFTLGAPQALQYAQNTGTADLTATISDVSQLTADDYQLRYDGSAWSLTRSSTGQAVPLTGAGTAANPFVADGVSLVLTGAANAGDRFLIRPARGAADSISVAISDPRRIAAAGPVRTSSAVANIGSATIGAAQVLDATNANLLSGVNITFGTPPNTYSVNGAGSFAYTSGSNIDVNGWRVQISGTPAAGDSFRVESNAGGVGDNRNALLLGNLQTKGLLAGGTTSISEAVGSLVGSVGTATRQANLGLEAQTSITSQAREHVLSISGVNLDEEAADLLRWQQAYKASAQAMAVADTLFQTLLNAVAR